MNVLVVDDLPFMRMLMTQAVEEAGFQVARQAVNGRQAVRIFRENPGLLTLMDINMPVMDGMKALEKMLGINPRGSIIMCSTIDQRTLILRALNMGALDYIVKPFTSERVEDALIRARRRVERGGL